MRIANTYFHDVAKTFNQSRDVDRSNVRVADTELAVSVGAHRVNVATFIHTRHENGVIITTRNLSDLDVEAADLGNVVGYALFTYPKLTEVVI